MGRKQLEYRGRNFINENDVALRYPIGIESVRYFEKCINKCAKYILYSYRCKDISKRDKYLSWAVYAVRLWPEYYELIKSQLDKRHGR